jgi:gamma-glutamyltranspeptidase/glutathione hydrolase
LAKAFNELDKSTDPTSRRAHFPNGVPTAGATWVQTDLGRLLRRLGDEGPRSFYTGDIAETISAQVRAGGGWLAAEDLHAFKARVVEPLHINYRGYDLYTPPLPSGGLGSLATLKTLEQFPLSEFTPWGAPYVELFAGASNLVWAERFKHFGDPDFVDVPVEELLSEKRAMARAEQLRRGPASAPPRAAEASHTVNIVVVDKDQNVVSWTATHGADFGSHVAIDGLGLMLGHGMSRFAFTSPDPNAPAPGKRPQHNMSPMLALRDGKPYGAWGLPGGRRIVSVTTQLAVNLIDFHASPRQAVTAPLIHTEGQEPIQVTADTATAVVEELRRRGRSVDVQPSLGGAANAAVIDTATGTVAAAASGGSTGVLMF